MTRIPTKIGHVHLKVRDLDRAVDFYTRFLGLNVTERIGHQFAFLSAGTMHHEVALQALGPDAPSPPRHGVGLYHTAFEVPDRRMLAEVYRLLINAEIDVNPIDHRISWALYFNDPDGNGLEVYCDTRTDEHGVARWQGFSRPLPAARLTSLLDRSAPTA